MTAKKTEEPDPKVGGIFSVFQHPDLDVFAGSQPIAVPNFDYSGETAPEVAAIDLTAAAAEETHPSGRKSASHSKEN